MKKIININLSGRVIPIEDTAYEKLQNYIESLRKYFAHEEGRDEIINDIESRIAELLNEKIRKGANNTTEADVEEIITSMGRVEDFEADAITEPVDHTQQENYREQEQPYEKKKRNRLYRNNNDKFIGGVCSGLAEYMNVSPEIVRFIFAIVTLGGFGLGILIYLLLWIILPSRDLEPYSGRRLYRNPDEKVIGGVAGGLAAYFDRSVTMIRLIFAAPIILGLLMNAFSGSIWHFGFGLSVGFGSLSGTFILIYIVLWIVLPEAITDYDKMEMRGEKVDVNRIKRNVQEGRTAVKDKLKDWSHEVKESAQQITEKGKQMSAEVTRQVNRNRSGIGHAFAVLFKVFFLFVAGTIAFALFVGIIAFIFGGAAFWPINNFLWTSKMQQLLAWGTLIFFLVVPLVAFITWIIRRLMRVKSKKNYLGWTFGALWTIGWIAAISLAVSLSKDFRNYEHVDQPITITQPQTNKMIVAVTEPELNYKGRFGWMNDGPEGWDLSNDTLRLSTVKFSVVPSLDSFYHVTMKKHSFGRTEENALQRAEEIQYHLTSKDSVLDLANSYAIGKKSKFRGQQVEIEIKVPVGKQIRFDESINEKLNAVNVRVYRKWYNNRIESIEINDRGYRFRSGVDYTMGFNGKLQANIKEVINADNQDGYRYDDQKKIDSADILRQIQELEKKQKESNQKIEELKNELKPEAMLQVLPAAKNTSVKDIAVLSPVSVLISSDVSWF